MMNSPSKFALTLLLTVPALIACNDDGGADAGSGTDETSGQTSDSDSDTSSNDEVGTTMADTGSTGDGDTGSTGDGDTGSTGDGDTGTGDTGSTGDGDTGTGDTGGGVCQDGCDMPNCGACPDGPPAIDTGLFAIDATEVSNAQYEAFWMVDFDPDYLAELMPASCDWKTDFTPEGWPLDSGEDLPVVGVDWCDAYAYCAWSGKRLCGAVGGEAAALADLQNPVNNEWYRACSQGGISNYPYGLVYEADLCNGADAGFGQAVEVGSLAGCEGGYADLFDMSGNVWEWTNACDDDNMVPANEQECRRRGGSYFSDGPTLRCGIDSMRPRDFRNANNGFRCCAD